MANDEERTNNDEREEEYDALIQKLLDNGYQNTPYSLLHNIYPFANESKYIGIYQDEQNDVQYPLIDNKTRDLEYSKDNSETIASEINKMVISTNLNSTTSNISNMRLRSATPTEKAKSLVSSLNYSPQATSNSGSSLPACARADRLGTTWFSIGALLGRTRDEGLCASWNRYLNYTSSAVVKDIHDVLWKSKIENNKGKNPTKDPDRASWNRGIVNSELYNQRFNIWNVSMTEGSPIIKLTSYGDFKYYKFTEQQLVNGLEISFLPTQAGSGYSAGSSYTINIDGIEKKLFEDIDETIQGSGSNIVANQMLKIYYNSSADNGNGAFFVLKTGGEGGGDKKVGDVFWSDHIIDYEEGDTPRALIMNGQEVDLSIYPDFSGYLKTLKENHPEQFATDLTEWNNIEASSVFHSSTRTGQVNKYLMVSNSVVKLKCIYDTTGLTATGEDGTIQNQELPNTTTGGSFSNNTGSYAGYVRQEAVRGYYYVQVMSEKQEEMRTFHYCGSVNDEASLPSDASDGDIYCLSDSQELRCYSEKLGSWQYYPKPNFQANTRQVGEVFTSDHKLSSTSGDVHILDGSTISILDNKWMVNYITALKISNPEQFASTQASKTDEQFYYDETTKQLTLKKLVVREIVEDTIDSTGNGYVLYSDGWIEQKFSYDNGENTSAFYKSPLTFYKPFKDTNYDIKTYAIKSGVAEGETTGFVGTWGFGDKKIDKLVNSYWYQRESDSARYFTWIISGYVAGTTSTPSLKYIQLKPLTLDWSKTFNFKSIVNTYADLPTTAENGDVYYVSTEDTTNKKGNYVFGDNNTWYFIGDEKYFVENPFSYGFLMKSKANMIDNPCWLRSDGVVKEEATYTGFYQYLLDIWNNGIETTYTDKKGNTYSGKLKNGVIVLNYSDWGTIYSNYGIVNAFGINTTASQFYLPYGEESKRVLIEKKEPTEDDKNWYNLYSDGWCEQGIIVDAGSDVNSYNIEWTFLKEFRDINYSVQACAVKSDSNYYANVQYQHGGKYTNKIYNIGWVSGSSSARYGHYEVRGYVSTTEIANINYYDYYYVGNVIQNQSAIDVANVLAELETIKNSVVRIVKSDYISDIKYEVFNNGMCRQWGNKLYESGNKYDITLAIPYLDTSYNIQSLGYWDSSSAYSNANNVHLVMNPLKTTTSFSINTSGEGQYSCDWMTYGKIDLTTI